MPWRNQGGGNGGGNQGPWGGGAGSGGGSGGGGNRGGGGGRGGGGPQPPNLEEILRKGQDRFKGFIPSGGGIGRIGILGALVVLAVIWAVSGFYRVQADEQGVVLRFGKYLATTEPGLHWRIPAPVDEVIKPKVTRINRTEVGFRSIGESSRDSRSVDQIQESLMLTGDENIVDIDFAVLWRISDPKNFLFNLREPEGTVKAVAESVMREVIGEMKIDDVVTEKRDLVESRTRQLMQEALTEYGAGIRVTEVKLQQADPPSAVIDAFRDVQAAKADQERKRNEAEGYANDIIPRARGEASKITLEAEGYKEQTVAEAEGQVARYIAILQEYNKAKDVTRQRMYLEVMEKILAGTTKIVIDGKNGNGVVPYLPLPEVQKRVTGGASQGGTQ